jgi:hypothetical protein
MKNALTETAVLVGNTDDQGWRGLDSVGSVLGCADPYFLVADQVDGAGPCTAMQTVLYWRCQFPLFEETRAIPFRRVKARKERVQR